MEITCIARHYELGSQTINGKVFWLLASLSAVARGKVLVSNYGFWNTLFKSGPLNPAWKEWLKTLPKGPTAGGYIDALGVRSRFFSRNPCDD
jgi:hypothetical protein